MKVKLQKLFLILLVGILAIQQCKIAWSSPLMWREWTYDTPKDEIGQNVWGLGENLYVCGITPTTRENKTYSTFLLMKWTTSGHVIWNTTGSEEIISTLSIWANEEYVYFTGLENAQDTEKYEYPTAYPNSYGSGGGTGVHDMMGYSDRYYSVGFINDSVDANLTLVKCYNFYEGISTHPDSMGLWAYEFDDNQDEYGYDVWVDETGIYTLGYSEDEFGNQKLLLLDWYFSGGMNWKKEWSLPSYNIIGKSVVAKDGNLYTLGTIQLNNTQESDIVLIGWDNDGNVLWNSTWGGSGAEIAESMWILQNSIYCVGQTDGQVFMVEFDQNGDFVENHSIPELYHYSEFNQMWGDESNLYIAGYTNTTEGDTSLVLLSFGEGITNAIPGYSIVSLVGILAMTFLLLTIRVKRKRKARVS